MYGRKFILMATLLAAPAFASETEEESPEVASLAESSYEFTGEYDVVLEHPGRRPHPNPHKGRRRWADGRRHGGHFGATASVSFAYHQARPNFGGQLTKFESIAIGLEVRSGLRDSFSMSLILTELNEGVGIGYRRYVAGDFDRGLFVGANVGELGVGFSGAEMVMFGEGVAGAKYTDRRGLTVEFGVGVGMFRTSSTSELLGQGFVMIGQSI